MVHIAAIADLHCKSNFAGKFRALFAQISENANILLLCGDLVNYGLPEEAHVLVKELTDVTKPDSRHRRGWGITSSNPARSTKCKRY